MRQLDPVDRIARNPRLDRVSGAVRDAVKKMLPAGRVKDALHGVWLGHPVHPPLAQAAVGCFTAAALLDVAGDRGRAPARLIRWGVLASLPAAVAGLADYAEGHEEQQRVGVVHAAANSTALLGYLASLRLRAGGKPGPGVALGLLAFGCAGAGAMLGGDLAFRWAMGPNHAAEVPHAGPEEWCDLGRTEEFLGAGPVRRMAGLIPVLVMSDVDGVTVLHDRCSHMAAPLHQGEIGSVDGAACVTCPWHGSVFRLTDGAVVRGPATAPQPALDTRVEAGRLYAKVRTIPGVSAS
jgi:nitrite reductase/ring-hydroxylating ferredoxin subunit